MIATSDNAGAGTVYRYGPYGEPSSWTGSRFRYTGQIALPEVSLYHYKARVYDPVLGRFLQTDPVGYKDDFNLYAYVYNDPVNAVDPTGLSCQRQRDGQYLCKVDRGTKDLTPAQSKQLKALERAYSTAVNKLLAGSKRPGKGASVTVAVPGYPSFTVSPSQVAQRLITSTVSLSAAVPEWSDANSPSGRRIDLNPDILGYSSGQQQQTFTHEAIHWTGTGPTPRQSRSSTGEWSVFNPADLGLIEHDAAYDAAADRLLDAASPR